MRWSFFFFVLANLYLSAPEMKASDRGTIDVQSWQLRSDTNEGPSLDIYTFTIKPGSSPNPSEQTSSAPGLRFFIQAGLHGNETLTTVFAQWLKLRLMTQKGPLAQLPVGTEIDFLPMANPRSFGSQRYNSNQVNLNRNFSVLWGLSREPAGKQPFSEPETKIIRELFKRRNYTAAVDIHGYLPWIVGPSSPSDLPNSRQHQTKAHAAWSKSLRKLASQLPNYQYKEAARLGDGGAFEDWAFWEQASFAFCLEMSHRHRFVTPPNHSSAVDSFALYEAAIFQAFQRASELRQQLPAMRKNQPLAIENEATHLRKKRSH